MGRRSPQEAGGRKEEERVEQDAEENTHPIACITWDCDWGDGGAKKIQTKRVRPFGVSLIDFFFLSHQDLYLFLCIYLLKLLLARLLAHAWEKKRQVCKQATELWEERVAREETAGGAATNDQQLGERARSISMRALLSLLCLGFLLLYIYIFGFLCCCSSSPSENMKGLLAGNIGIRRRGPLFGVIVVTIRCWSM